jgi:hypothetical protein
LNYKENGWDMQQALFLGRLHFGRLPFLRKSELVARKQGPCAGKASAQLFRISDCGFRIFLVFFFNPHSAIGIPQFGGGPIGRPAGRPYIGITLFSGKEWLARPARKQGPWA